MSDRDFVAQYAVLSDEDLTQLASEGGLLPEADAALCGEMRKRSIGSAQVRSLQLKQTEAKLQMSVCHNPTNKGTGLRLRGHKFLNEADREKGIFVVTRWIEFGYMPLIPIGSYRVKELQNATPQIVSKVQLQWDQVLDGWKRSAIIILAIVGFMVGMVWWAEHNRGR